MTGNPYLSFISVVFTCLILLAAFTVLSPFLLPILWSAVIAVATWPLHVRIKTRVGGKDSLAAGISTTIIALTLVAPMAILLIFIVKDMYSAVDFFIAADRNGAPVPHWLSSLPVAGQYLAAKWDTYLSHPHQLSGLVQEWISAKLGIIQEMAQDVLLGLTTRFATLLFALWILFFLYRDGETLIARVNRFGYRWLQRRWPSYAFNIPPSLRAAVNGLVIVAFGEAVILSLMFGLFGLPSAVLLGVLTAALAFLPGAGPLLLAVIGSLMFVSGSPISGIFVFGFGTTLLMLADYMIRPMLIQGSTEIPFMAILFGILGGIATMGILGLIIGPVILVLLQVLVREASVDESADLGF